MTFDPAILFAFANFALVASITPGPNNLMVMASGAAFGLRATVPHIGGIVLGFTIMVGAVALGLGALLAELPLLAFVLKWVGVIWLCALAWRLARPALFPRKGEVREAGQSARGRPMTFVEAALFQWVNPKSWTLAIAVTAAYSDLAPEPWQRAVLMSLAFCVIAPVSNGVWLIAGGAIRTLLDDAFWGRASLLAMSGMIVVSALLIALG